MKPPSRKQISEHMRRLIHKRWNAARMKIENGEIPPEARGYNPRGPMPDDMRRKKIQRNMEHVITRARIVNAALRGDHLTPGEVNATVGKRGRRRYINYHGERPQKFLTEYRWLVKACLKEIRKEFGI